MKDHLPNFDQFIEFLLVDNDFDKNLPVDPHLNFYWKECDMCHMHYDVIGKAETSKEDLDYIFAKVRKV